MTKPQTDVIGLPPVSECCQAPVKVISGDEGTSYWECTKCGQSCDLYQPPQTEPKNAPKDVSRLARRSTKVDKPTIAQAEQKIEEQIRRVFRGRTHKSVRKLEVITEKDQLKHKTIVAPYEPTVEKLAVLFTKLLTASNREARIDELERVQMRLVSVGIGENKLSKLNADRLSKLKEQG